MTEIPKSAASTAPVSSQDDTLNPQQRAAVTHENGPLLIVAGAGTGKTTVITRRVHWLLDSKRAKPHEVLALTFTDKAAGEMVDRLDRLLPYGTVDLWVMTFHSFCQKLLVDHGIEIGIADAGKLLDTTEQWLLVRKHLERFALDHYRPMGNPTKFIHALLRHFSRAKDEAITPEQYLQFAKELQLNTDSDGFLAQVLTPEEREALSAKELKELAAQEVAKVREVAEAYHAYQQLLAQTGAMDFGDLITNALRLLRERPKILAHYRAQFKYLLVDEFQDTNLAQYQLIKLLAEPRNNVTVVGDDDQSIYKFRGASVANILQFKKDYPKASEVVLTTNYRSRQNILDLAYQFIQRNNPERLEALLDGGISKQLQAAADGSAVIEHLALPTGTDEVSAVVQKISELKASDPDATWSDFAILVRANDHAEAFTYGLDAAGVPYTFVASRGLYRKPAVLDIVAFLKLLDDYREGPAMHRYLNWPVWELEARTLVELGYQAKRRALSLYAVLQHAVANEEIREEDRERCAKALRLIDSHTAMAKRQSVREVALSALERSGYLKWLGGRQDHASQQAASHLNQFFTMMTEFESSAEDSSVRSFLEYLRLQQEAGESGSLLFDPDLGPQMVKVMTVHAAKGLEFRYVFIVNLVDRRFPTSERAEVITLPDGLINEAKLPHGDVHLQEERRLFYVACTRAKEGLWLTSAAAYGGSRGQTRARKPSQFLTELGLVQQAEATRPTGRVVLPEAVERIKRGSVQPSEREGHREYFRLPPRFSYTQLKSYETCPWQYRFAFLMQIPVRGKGTFSFGKTMHDTLQKFFALIQQRQHSQQGDLFGGQTDTENAKKTVGELASLEELLNLYAASWVDEWFASPQDKEEHRERGRTALKGYYAAVRGSIIHPKHLEQGFSLKVDDDANGRQFTLYGRIDRVDELDDGSLEIIDYKTGATKTELKTEDKEQLLIYQLAALEVFTEPVKRLSFQYLESGTQQSFLGAERDLQRVRRKVLDTIHEIERGEFVATPGVVCKFCDFREICEFRQF